VPSVSYVHLDFRNLADKEAARRTAREFVKARLDVIVGFGNPIVRAAPQPKEGIMQYGTLRRLLLTVAVVLLPSLAAAHPPDDPFDDDVFAPIRGGGPKITLEQVAEGLVAPLKGTTAPGLPNHLFVPDQPGKLYAIDLTTGTKTVFLDVSSLLVPLGVIFGPGCVPPVPAGSEPSFDERGLLGVAFHPDFQNNGKFYTYTSEPTAGLPTLPTTIPPGASPDHQNVISEWIANDPADPTAGVDPDRRVLIRVDWPQFNHDGGDLAFGPDGKLYISMGDGGGADDQDGQMFIVTGTCGTEAPMVGHGPTGNGQRLTTPLGKILRIDVNPPFDAGKEYAVPADNPPLSGALGEIFAYGFRNPYRISFDTATGDLYLGDVGQNDIEEVNRVVKGGNHGWRLKEGTLCFDPGGFGADSGDAGFCAAPVPGVVDPIAQYDTHFEGHSVIGGFVYHGSTFPALRDRYVFGEFSRLFNFPAGPNNYGRLLYLAQKPHAKAKLFNIQELNGFAEAAEGLGITDPSQPPAAFPQTLAVLGIGQDATGELYVMGNINGIPFDTDGVVLRITPANKKRK
jgi:glucose/arabinose dehydrogenase